MQKLESIWKTTVSYALRGGLFLTVEFFYKTIIMQRQISAFIKSAACYAVTAYSLPLCACT